MEYDYVIIGSGAGGSVLAGGLSAGSDASILVIAAGASDRNPIHLISEERVPGREVRTETDFGQLGLTAGSSGNHPLGSCAIGPNADDVVDARWRVRGVDDVRVVDASVFPRRPSGHTPAPIQALARHAAELIVEDA